MKLLMKATTYITRYIGILILIFSFLAFLKPEVFIWSIRYTALFLGIAMFGMGLTIHTEDFKIIFSNPKEIFIGCLAQYTIMPLAAWLLAIGLKLPPDLAIGVILVGCCPGGTASNVITYIAGGDIALSVGMTIISTLLAPVITPLLVYLLGGMWVDVSFMVMVSSIVRVILIPILLGLLIHKLLGKHSTGIQEAMPLVSSLAIIIIITGIIASNKKQILSSGIFILGIVIIHNLLGIFLGLFVSKILKISYKKATAIAIEVGMQNSGLAVSLAASNFAAAPLATLPGAIFSVWHNISGSIFASIRRQEA